MDNLLAIIHRWVYAIGQLFENLNLVSVLNKYMKIQQTEDYSSFKRISGNRTINKAQVKKLFESFGNNPELAAAAPIIVNEQMQIVDGQHRLEALKKLGLPITYVIVEGLSMRDVQTLNSATKTWTPLDYAKSFSELGMKDYGVYLEFRKKYHLSHNILISYLSTGADDMRGRGNTVQTFRAGKFEVADVKRAHLLCQQLIEMQQYYDRGDARAFALAFKIAASHPKYDHARMIAKTAEHPEYLKDSPYAEDYMRQLEKIYNYHCGVNRVKLF